MIFTIMGKSASGKDTVLHELMKKKLEVGLEKIIPYTTRPIRSGEKDGAEYYFVEEGTLKKLQRDNRVVECRVYHTVHGDWYYFTVDEKELWDIERRYLYIATLESYQKIRDFYGMERVVPIYLETDDYIRLNRAINRERNQEAPSYTEVCRRYLADEEDFSEKQLRKLGIVKRFHTEDLTECCQNILNEIKRY